MKRQLKSRQVESTHTLVGTYLPSSSTESELSRGAWARSANRQVPKVGRYKGKVKVQKIERVLGISGRVPAETVP